MWGGSAGRASHIPRGNGHDAFANSNSVSVRNFGAKGDGRNIDSAAINRAIEFAATRGGGTVYFPAGRYLSYSIRLRSNITLHLDSGAVVLAASTPLQGMADGGYDMAEPQDPSIEPFQDFGHNHWHNSLIWGEDVHDVAIVGDGLIWGRGLSRGHDEDKALPLPHLAGVASKAIALKNCRNVRLCDFRVLEGGWFALLATGVDNLTIDNLLVDTNRDGFDIDCCRNVRVTNCTVNSPHDDGICLKSSFALGYARSTENVMIANCCVSGSYEVGTVLDGTFKVIPEGGAWTIGRIKFGTESNGGFKNITITNCIFDRCRGLALETVDGAQLEDISISNITMRGATTSPLFLRLGSRMRGPRGATVGTLKRVMISNITSSGAVMLPSIIAGIANHPIEDIHISDVFLEQIGGALSKMAMLQPPEKDQGYPEPTLFGDLPACGIFVRHAKDIVLRHIEIATIRSDHRPALWARNVDGLELTGMRYPKGSTYLLDRVENFRDLDKCAA
jgi:polygalacturonase